MEAIMIWAKENYDLLGLLVGVEFDSDIAADVKHDAFDNKLLMSVVKPNTIRMVPPLIVTKEDCDKAFDLIKGSLLK